MLDPNEKLAFDTLVARLQLDDPSFSTRVDRLARRPRRQLRLAFAILLWTIAPICIVFGGWTGVIFAVAGVSYGAYLMAKRGPGEDKTTWWSSSPYREPGAAI